MGVEVRSCPRRTLQKTSSSIPNLTPQGILYDAPDFGGVAEMVSQATLGLLVVGSANWRVSVPGSVVPSEPYSSSDERFVLAEMLPAGVGLVAVVVRLLRLQAQRNDGVDGGIFGR